MNKCSICGREEKQVGTYKFEIDGQKSEIPAYNMQLLTLIKGKHICDECMDIYYKIYALMQDEDFSCGGEDYYADGRNLE